MPLTIPNLKRVKITSHQALGVWLAANADAQAPVMLVTFAEATSDKHLSTDQVQAALADFGWTAGRRYTLNSDLIGHVVHKA